jgi:phosphoribosylformylglycinamidine synthase
VKFGVVIFPGSNCDQDLIEVLSSISSSQVEKLWHKSTDLKNCTHIFLPGGFSYGDYLRSGAIAKLSPIMESVIKHANQGGFVMGICNGFQILCEAGLLPGALLRNSNMKFVCENVFLNIQNNETDITKTLEKGDVLKIPIAHGEGRYYCDEETLFELESNQQILFKYCTSIGDITVESNPNGSLSNIAGISNKEKNVFGMMPHPERCSAEYLLNIDGKSIFNLA